MNYSFKEIIGIIDKNKAIGSIKKEAVDDQHKKENLFNVLTLLPKEVVDEITKDWIFIIIENKTSGETWPINHPILKDKKGLILLLPHAWSGSGPELAVIITHEIAHAYLGHNPQNNAIEGEMETMEMEAKKQAFDWLKEHYTEEDLRRVMKLE